MTTKAVLGIVCALTLGASPLVGAVQVPFLEGTLSLQTPSRSSARPEPARLDANWWQYFEAGGAELEQRVAETRQWLDAFLAGLPADIAEAARPVVTRIQANLRALPEARARPSPEPPLAQAYAQHYTVSQLLDIVGRLSGERTTLAAERIDAASAEKAVRAARGHVDTLLAAYLALAPGDPERSLRGLEIMADRSALALAEERLRIDRAALSAHEALVNQLAQEQVVAAERLAAMETDPARLDAELQQARNQWQQAHEQFIGAQGRALSVVGEDLQSRTLALYRQQQVVSAAVAQAIALARLVRLQAERHLVGLLLDASDSDTAALHARLAQWQGELADIRQQSVIWAGASARERDRASERLASAVGMSGAGPSRFDLTNLFNEDRLTLAQQTLVALQRLEIGLAQAEQVVQLLDSELGYREGRLRDWLARAGLALRQFWETALGWAGESLFKIAGIPVTMLGLLRITLILFVAWWVSHGLRRALKRAGERRDSATQALFYTIGRLSHYLIIILGLMIGLTSIGFDFTNFALVAGAVILGVGFGLRAILFNFVAGLILLVDRSLKVGDFIELDSGLAGEVQAINMRSTLIRTNDDVDIVVPNSEFINAKIVNWTLEEGPRRIHVPFRVAYGSDIERVRQVALEVADRLPYTAKERTSGVWLVDFGENSLDYELVVWITPAAVKRPGAVYAAYKGEIETILRKYGIEVPIPQRDLRLRSGFEAEEREPMPGRWVSGIGKKPGPAD
ncbi:MAG TPA: mechanosensitive ion channel domain-containing protein [Candidatus Competibacteraceae bacterium]|nr:mechanosensitive ion channel domain-containing protein [Candidatus Competibacteraceae bacterium]